jgi:hypothetical protein
MARAVDVQDLARGNFGDEDSDRHWCFRARQSRQSGIPASAGMTGRCCGMKQVPRLRLGMTHRGMTVTVDMHRGSIIFETT